MKWILLLLIPLSLFGQSTVGEYIYIDAVGNVDIEGQVTYDFAHIVASADSIAYTPTITQNEYLLLAPGMTAHEADNVTLSGDTLTVSVAGDYFINISVRFSGANQNDVWRIKVYINGSPTPSSVGRFVIRTTSAGEPDVRSFFWYLQDLAVDDEITFTMTNYTASRNPTFTDFKIYMEKKPE